MIVETDIRLHSLIAATVVMARGVAVPLSKAHDRHWALCGELTSTCIPPCRHDLRHKKIRFYATNVFGVSREEISSLLCTNIWNNAMEDEDSGKYF